MSQLFDELGLDYSFLCAGFVSFPVLLFLFLIFLIFLFCFNISPFYLLWATGTSRVSRNDRVSVLLAQSMIRSPGKPLLFFSCKCVQQFYSIDV